MLTHGVGVQWLGLKMSKPVTTSPTKNSSPEVPNILIQTTRLPSCLEGLSGSLPQSASYDGASSESASYDGASVCKKLSFVFSSTNKNQLSRLCAILRDRSHWCLCVIWPSLFSLLKSRPRGYHYAHTQAQILPFFINQPLVAFLKYLWVTDGPSKCYAPLMKESCNNYLKFVLNHR